MALALSMLRSNADKRISRIQAGQLIMVISLPQEKKINIPLLERSQTTTTSKSDRSTAIHCGAVVPAALYVEELKMHRTNPFFRHRIIKQKYS